MADDNGSAGWALPPRPNFSGDIQYTNTLPDGGMIPYGSLGAQLFDALKISRTLPGAPDYPRGNRYQFGGLIHPGGGYPLPGQGGYGQPGGGGPMGGGGPGGGGGPTPGGSFVHGNDPAGTGNNQFGPFAPPTGGVSDWRSTVSRLLGGGNPVSALQQLFGSAGSNASNAQRSLTGGGMDPYTATQMTQAFGGSGAEAEQSARRLGLLGQFTAGGQSGLRNIPGVTWATTPEGQQYAVAGPGWVSPLGGGRR
jgi:hypothetical protein